MQYFTRCVIILVAAACTVGAAGGDQRLIAAVRNGDAVSVRALLAARVDVNAVEPDGTTALHWAVRIDDAATVERLIRAGARVGLTNRYGVSPLMLASVNGNAAIIAALLNAGADPNSSYPDGASALMVASSTGTPAAVKALLDRGAHVDAQEGVHGQTALMWAAAEDNVSAVQVLVEKGADLNVRSQAGFTALLFAARAGHIRTVLTLLADGADVNQTLPDGTTPLVLALINAHYELAATLLDRGADPNQSTAGFTALHQVAWTRRPNHGHAQPPPVQTGNLDSLALVKKLLSMGANPNARVTRDSRTTGLSALNRKGATPYLLAAKGCDVELMRLLVSSGADPRLKTADDTTPLMVASGVGMFAVGEDPGSNDEALEAAKVAMELGDDVNAVDKNGDTALHGAAFRGANPLVQFLVDHGARMDVRNNRDWMPLTIAEGIYHRASFKAEPQTAALLRELMGKAQPPSSVVQPR